MYPKKRKGLLSHTGKASSVDQSHSAGAQEKVSKTGQKGLKTAIEQKADACQSARDAKIQKEPSPTELTAEMDLTHVDKQQDTNIFGVEQKPQLSTKSPSKRRSKAKNSSSKTSSTMEWTTEKEDTANGWEEPCGTDNNNNNNNNNNDDPSASSSSTVAGVDSLTAGPAKQLTHEQAYIIALMAARGNEQLISRGLRSASSRTGLIACPVDPSDRLGADMLEVEPGDVVLCESFDVSGWGFGTICAPARLAGQRGCFRCGQMRPVIVEVAYLPTGEERLIFTQGKWEESNMVGNASNMRQHRLRQKAIQNRVRIARTAWEKTFPAD